MITIASCVPPQRYSVEDKIGWLQETLIDYKTKKGKTKKGKTKKGKNKIDALFLPQEWFGGHYAMQLATKHRKKMRLHFGEDEIRDLFGDLAKKYNVALGVGACVTSEDDKQLATEDYLYFEKDGKFAGSHRKFALPAYDDARSKGAGRLLPETSFGRRARPVDLESIGLRIGTVFCWEVYTRALPGAYGFNDVNLLVHPIKFAPRGWLKKSKPGQTLAQVPKDMQYKGLTDDEIAIIGFGQDDKSEDWIKRLSTVAHYDTLCPIAVSCNTWDLGPKYRAITGFIDPFTDEQKKLINFPSVPGKGTVKLLEMEPKVYGEGVNNVFSAGAYKEAVGTIDGLNEMRRATMSIKMRRLEAHLIGGTTDFDVDKLLAKFSEPDGPVWRRQKKAFKQRVVDSARQGDTAGSSTAKGLF